MRRTGWTVRGALVLGGLALVLACGPSFTAFSERVMSPHPCATKDECREQVAQAEKYLRECHHDAVLEKGMVGEACDREFHVAARARQNAADVVAAGSGAEQGATRSPHSRMPADSDTTAADSDTTAADSPKTLQDAADEWRHCVLSIVEALETQYHDNHTARESSHECELVKDHHGLGRDPYVYRQCTPHFQAFIEEFVWSKVDLDGCEAATSAASLDSVCAKARSYFRAVDGLRAPPGLSRDEFEYCGEQVSWEPNETHRAKAQAVYFAAACRLGAFSDESACAWIARLVRTNPPSPARDRLAKILADVAPRLDESAWRGAQVDSCKHPAKSDACSAVVRYLQDFSGGAHAVEARQVLAAAAPRLAVLKKAEDAADEAAVDAHWRSRFDCEQKCKPICAANGNSADECRGICNKGCQ